MTPLPGAGKPCVSCHSRFAPLAVSVAAPPEVAPGEAFTVAIVAQNAWRHDATRNAIAVSAVNARVETPSGSVADLRPGARGEWSASLVAGEKGPITIEAKVTTRSYHNHKSASNPDERSYEIVANVAIPVTAAAPTGGAANESAPGRVALSTRVLTANAGETSTASVTLSNAGAEPVRDVRIDARAGVTASPAFLASLAPGESREVAITLATTQEGSLSVPVRWTSADGTAGSSSIAVTSLAAPLVEAPDPGLAWGRAYGFIAIAAVVAGTAHGSLRKVVERRLAVAAKAGKPVAEPPKERYRWWFVLHTSILYGIILFTALHAWLLFEGGWRGEFEIGLLLGLASLLLFGMVGVTGLFPAETTKLVRVNWRKVHLWVTLLASVIALAHAGLLWVGLPWG